MTAEEIRARLDELSDKVKECPSTEAAAMLLSASIAAASIEVAAQLSEIKEVLKERLL